MKANVWEKLFYDGKNWFFSVDIMLINDIILNFLEKIQTSQNLSTETCRKEH